MYKLSRFNRAALVLVKACAKIFYNDFNYPQPIKGRYDVATNLHEKLKWAYRHWVKQLEHAELGQGIEEHFAAQDLDFPLPADFEQETSASISAGGDLMAVEVLNYDNTTKLFDNIEDFYFAADIICANLETPVYAGAPSGRVQTTTKAPSMNTTEDMVDRFLADGRGINFFCTANNHSYDQGEEGLLATMDVLDRKSCLYSGTNRSPEQQEDVLIIEKNGIKIAMLVYTFDMNGKEYDKKYLINEVRFCDENPDLSLVERHIARAHERGADIIVAHCHWGWEYEMYPHKNVMEVAKRLVDMGVDVILGGHPHVAQPMERIETLRDGIKKQALVVYSLGNFVSYHPISKNCKLTYVPRFKIVKGLQNGASVCHVTQLEVLPIYIMTAEMPDGSFDCRLLKLKSVLNDSAHEYALTEQEREDLPRLYEHLWKKLIMPAKPVPGSNID